MDLLQMLGMAFGGQSSMGNIPMPGVVTGFGGGTFNPDGTQATPYRNWGEGDDMQMDPRTQVPQGRRPIGQGNPMERKSPLGIGGKARDILGGLGDALLIGTGNQPRYAPKRQNERLQDVMSGIDMNDPQAVFERIAQEDPEMALKFMQASSLANYREGGLGVRRGDLDRKNTKDAITNEDRVVQGLGGYAGSVDTQEKLDRFREISARRLEGLNLTPDDIGIPKTFTPGVMTDWAENGIPAYKQRMLSQGDTRNQIGQQNANSNTVKAAAAQSQAGSRAALVPSQVKRNEAGTANSNANTDRVYGRNGTIQSGSQPGLMGTPAEGGLPPGVRSSKSAGDKIRLPDGTKLLGDGKGGWINKGR